MHCRGPLRISQLLLVASQLQEGSTSIPRAGIVASLCRKLDSSYASAYIRSTNKERPRPQNVYDWAGKGFLTEGIQPTVAA